MSNMSNRALHWRSSTEVPQLGLMWQANDQPSHPSSNPSWPGFFGAVDAVASSSCSNRSWKPEPRTPMGIVTKPTPINPQRGGHCRPHRNVSPCFTFVPMLQPCCNHLQPSATIVHVWHPLLRGGNGTQANSATMAPIKAEMNFPASGRRAHRPCRARPCRPRVNAVSGPKAITVVYSHSGASPDKFRSVTHLARVWPKLWMILTWYTYITGILGVYIYIYIYITT